MKRIPAGARNTFFAGLAAILLVPTACSSKETNRSGGGSADFPASLTLTPVAKGLDEPVTIANAGDGSDRLFILEQKGTVRILRDGKLSPTPFLDIRKLVRSGGERGLLGIAFPPDFKESRTFYVDYTGTKGGDTAIESFKVGGEPDRADPATRRTLLGIKQPYANHNGGQIAFGPDGYLYIGTGDGGSGGDPHNNGQRKDTLLGKLLRIDVRSDKAPYAIPRDNPFGDEIWAYGLRNPWRFSFDRKTGDLYIADVGQNEVEEIDFQAAGTGAGANYGWKIMEGSRCFKKRDCNKEGLVLPVAEYLQGKGDCSVTGGYVYRGSNAKLQGIYLYGDFCSGRIWGLRKAAGKWQTKLLLDTTHSISTFGEDEKGALYLADYGSGTIYRIDAP